jgi:hypothetical protein
MKISSTDSDSKLGISQNRLLPSNPQFLYDHHLSHHHHLLIVRVKDLLLKPEDKKTLLSGGWLSDRHIYAAKKLLKTSVHTLMGCRL